MPGTRQSFPAESHTVTATADGRRLTASPSRGAVRLRPPVPLWLRQ